MKAGKQGTFFLILTGLTLLGGGGFAFMQYSANGEKANEVAKLRKDARSKSELEAELELSKTALTEANVMLDHLEQGIPPFAYVPTMLRELEAVGTKNGIEVLGVRPFEKKETKPKNGENKESSQRKGFQELNIEIKGRGTYRSVLNFVTALQQFPKIVAVRTVTLTPKTEPNQTGPARLDATVEIRAFVFAESEPKKPAATEEGKINVSSRPGVSGGEVKLDEGR